MKVTMKKKVGLKKAKQRRKPSTANIRNIGITSIITLANHLETSITLMSS